VARENGAYARARGNFDKAGKDTAHRAKSVVCGAPLDADGKVLPVPPGTPGTTPCPAMGLYLTTFRKDRMRFKGKCELGHLTERYGYANHEVIDE
jgi:hypothetical protein